MRNYERPRMPQNWSGEARNFYLALIDVLDRLHLPIKKDWLDDKLKAEISTPKEEDTGWVNLTLSNCTAWSDSDIPQIRKVGKLVFMRGGIRLNASLSSTGTIKIADIDERFTPKDTRAQLAVWNDSTSARNMAIQIPQDEGVINLRSRSSSSVSTSVYISLTASYPID